MRHHRMVRLSTSTATGAAQAVAASAEADETGAVWNELSKWAGPVARLRPFRFVARSQGGEQNPLAELSPCPFRLCRHIGSPEGETG